MQELMAIPLALSSFASLLNGSLVTFFIDNNGALCSLIKGSAGAADLNRAIGMIWQGFAKQHVGFYGARVESAANLADGPTRDEFAHLSALGARYMEPSLPEWAYHVWEFDARL